MGGNWDWDRNVFGVNAGVSAVGTGLSDDDFQKVDAKVDDGDLNTGRFRRTATDRYTYVVKE